jgi:hypothetical protein
VLAIRLTPIGEWKAEAPETLLPEQERNALSFPLLMALSGLADAIHDPAWPQAEELKRRLQH